MLTFDEAVSALQRQIGCSYDRAVELVRHDGRYADSEPVAVVKDERVLEKAEQVEVRKLAIAYGFKVRNFSQARESRIAFGVADLLLSHNSLPIALWWETKRQVGGARSTTQVEFADDMTRCQIGYGYGDRYAFVEKLLELELAVRGAGQYGIEPIRLQVTR